MTPGLQMVNSVSSLDDHSTCFIVQFYIHPFTDTFIQCHSCGVQFLPKDTSAFGIGRPLRLAAPQICEEMFCLSSHIFFTFLFSNALFQMELVAPASDLKCPRVWGHVGPGHNLLFTLILTNYCEFFSVFRSLPF